MKIEQGFWDWDRAIDDDGDLKDCKEMIVGNGVTIVLEQDDDGDVDVTFLDPIAAYI